MSFRLQAYKRQPQNSVSELAKSDSSCTVKITAKTSSALAHCLRGLEHQGGVLGLSPSATFTTHKQSRHSLLRGPFVHKKSQEGWQDHTYTTTLTFELPQTMKIDQFQELLVGSLDTLGDGTSLSFSVTSATFYTL